MSRGFRGSLGGRRTAGPGRALFRHSDHNSRQARHCARPTPASHQVRPEVTGLAIALRLATTGRTAALDDPDRAGARNATGTLMDWAAPELLTRFDELADVVAEADRTLAFGCPTCLVGGDLFFGVHEPGLFVKLPEDAAATLLAAGGVPFEPVPGRAMGGFFRAASRLHGPRAVGTPFLRVRLHVATEESEGGLGRPAHCRPYPLPPPSRSLASTTSRALVAPAESAARH